MRPTSHRGHVSEVAQQPFHLLTDSQHAPILVALDPCGLVSLLPCLLASPSVDLFPICFTAVLFFCFLFDILFCELPPGPLSWSFAPGQQRYSWGGRGGGGGGGGELLMTLLSESLFAPPSTVHVCQRPVANRTLLILPSAVPDPHLPLVSLPRGGRAPRCSESLCFCPLPPVVSW